MKKKDAMVKKDETALETFDYGDDAQGGYENQTKDDYTIPFIAVLQTNSPQCEDKENFPGAEPGMIFNTASEEISKKVYFIPSMTEHVFVEWKPRVDGGGFVAIHTLNSDVVKVAKGESEQFGKYKTQDGNDLAETFYVYGIIYDGDDDPVTGVVIAFTSTKIKPYKQWTTKMRSFQIKLKSGRKHQPPLFAHRVKLSTVKQKNKHGTFYNYTLRPAVENIKKSLLPPGNKLLEAAKDFGELVRSGATKPDYDKADRGGGDSENEKFDHF
jgi:hypothetical protein